MKQVYSLAVISCFIFFSCKKEGCTDITATNYIENAKVNDGTCTYERDAFLGTYNVTESCTYEDNGSYSVKVIEGPTTSEIILENLYNEGERVRAVIENNQATFKEDVVGITYEGEAFMLGSELNVNYEVCETFYYPCSDVESCSLTGK